MTNTLRFANTRRGEKTRPLPRRNRDTVSISAGSYTDASSLNDRGMAFTASPKGCERPIAGVNRPAVLAIHKVLEYTEGGTKASHALDSNCGDKTIGSNRVVTVARLRYERSLLVLHTKNQHRSMAANRPTTRKAKAEALGIALPDQHCAGSIPAAAALQEIDR